MISGAPNDVALKRGAKRRAGVKATLKSNVASKAPTPQYPLFRVIRDHPLSA